MVHELAKMIDHSLLHPTMIEEAMRRFKGKTEVEKPSNTVSGY